MNCQEVRENISRFLEEDLSSEERAQLERHLSTCETCRLELEALKRTVHSLRNLPSAGTPPGFSDRVMARIREEGSRPSLLERLFSPPSRKVPAYGLLLLLIMGAYYFLGTGSKQKEMRMAENRPAPALEDKSSSSRAARSLDGFLEGNAPPASAPALSRKKEKSKRVFARKPRAVYFTNRLKSSQEDLGASSLATTGGPPVQKARKEDKQAKIGLLDNVNLAYSFSSAPLFPARVRDRGASSLPDDETVALNIRLIDGEKEEKQLVVRRFWKNYRGKDGIASKTLFMSEWPNDASGAGFLIWDYSDPAKSRDLWLFIPSFGQVQQVSAGGVDDLFMGSDLTFRDLIRRHHDEDDIRILGELSCGVSNEKCYVVESVPKDKSEIYAKKILWVTEQSFITMKIEYYDASGNLLKTELIDWENISGYKMWKSAEVINARTQHKTIFRISNIEINTGLKDDIFTEQSLRSGTRR